MTRHFAGTQAGTHYIHYVQRSYSSTTDAHALCHHNATRSCNSGFSRRCMQLCHCPLLVDRGSSCSPAVTRSTASVNHILPLRLTTLAFSGSISSQKFLNSKGERAIMFLETHPSGRRGALPASRESQGAQKMMERTAKLEEQSPQDSSSSERTGCCSEIRCPR